MKKALVFGTIILAVAVIAFAAGNFISAYAQGTPQTEWGYGTGMMGGRGGHMGGGRFGGGMMGGTWGNTSGEYGPMHEYMVAALADGLGMTPEALQAEIDAGKTPYQVAVDQGLTAEQIADLFETAHDQAIQAAVDAGLLTQEQADWMDEHMQGFGGGYGPGRMGSGGCPGYRNFQNQTAPSGDDL